MPRQLRPVAERLMEHLELGPNGCWLSTYRNETRGGYRAITLPGHVKQLVHRAAYELWRGPVPDGLTLDHLCRAPACFNPDHLEPVTLAENLRRGDTFQARNAAKTHCPQGHPYDEANTRIKPTGQRECRACSRVGRRSLRQQQRAVIGGEPQ